MAARSLRYDWFEEIRQTHHFDRIVVAHHRDDQLETFFLNLARGTGIAGLTGMKAIHGQVVRPLLFASRLELAQYAHIQHLAWREDLTNSETVYKRNIIRHQLLPLMESLNPSFRDGLQATMLHLDETNSIFQQAIETAQREVIRKKPGDLFEISIAGLKSLTPLTTYLFELLKPWKFNPEVTNELARSLDGQSGKQFFSPTHRAILDREVILIQRYPETGQPRFYLDENFMAPEIPIRLTMKLLSRNDLHSFKTSSDSILVDRDKLQFPLILRKWLPGDYFYPFGMHGSKKLSDFFVDEKLSLAEKEKVWILANGEEIIWIVGLRLDDRFKIDDQTRQILLFRLMDDLG